MSKSFDITKLSAAGQVVAKALQTYGMFLADGGNIYTASALSSLQPSDFEIVDGGTRIDYPKGNCTRTSISQ